MESIETVVVGGGQAGVATSYHLSRLGREHLVLEQASQVADSWRNSRWDSFTLVTPNWTLRMPGAEYDGDYRDGYLPKDEIVSYFERYAGRFRLPVRYNARVTAIEPTSGRRFEVRTSDGRVEAENVVMATGWEREPKIPALAADLSPAVQQIHSSRYRNPESLQPGAVLVVGTGQSGCQIAEELYQSGRRVYLSTSGVGRAPRRYRGRDIFAWLLGSSFLDLPPERFPVPKDRFRPPHVSGKNGGHTLNLHQFARDGVTLLGRLRGVLGDRVGLVPDMHDNLARADGFESQIVQMIDRYVKASGIEAPADELPAPQDGFAQPIIEELDLRSEGILAVVWATGHSRDLGLVRMPILDEQGFPIQDRGVATHPGIYFVGMPWMPSAKSAILAGVGETAEHVASHIAARGSRGGRTRTSDEAA